MTVRSILDSKGRNVVTIAPERTLAEAAKTLTAKRIGAVVATGEDGRIAGILSERDIVVAIGERGGAALAESVASAMTAKVRSCREHDTVNHVMEIMTKGRFRHVPVEEDGKLVGIISIGDVVKRRIEDVEREAEDIRSYIATA